MSDSISWGKDLMEDEDEQRRIEQTAMTVEEALREAKRCEDKAAKYIVTEVADQVHVEVRKRLLKDAATFRMYAKMKQEADRYRIPAGTELMPEGSRDILHALVANRPLFVETDKNIFHQRWAEANERAENILTDIQAPTWQEIMHNVD